MWDQWERSQITLVPSICDPQQTIRCRPTACSPWPSRWTAPPTPVRARARRRRRRRPPSLQWRNCTTCIMIQWLSISDVFVPELKVSCRARKPGRSLYHWCLQLSFWVNYMLCWTNAMTISPQNKLAKHGSCNSSSYLHLTLSFYNQVVTKRSPVCWEWKGSENLKPSWTDRLFWYC